MGADTKIAWCDYTFNPWIGCTPVSAGCANCYAERDDARHRWTPQGWGKGRPRKRTSEAYWRQPLKWDREAAIIEGSPMRGPDWHRPRVFCASLADVFDEEVCDEWRRDMFSLIERCGNLDLLILTKRPTEMKRWYEAWCRVGVGEVEPLPNVWLGVTVENQETADERIPILLSIPAAVRFVSYEPAIGPVDFSQWLSPCSAQCLPDCGGGERKYHASNGPLLDWIIVGGESGPRARPCDVAWMRSTIRQCREAEVACFVKQMGANVRDRNDVGFEADLEVESETGIPTNRQGWPSTVGVEDNPRGYREEYQGAPVRVRLRDPKGADPSEWPEDLRVREFPSTTTPRGLSSRGCRRLPGGVV